MNAPEELEPIPQPRAMPRPRMVPKEKVLERIVLEDGYVILRVR